MVVMHVGGTEASRDDSHAVGARASRDGGHVGGAWGRVSTRDLSPCLPLVCGATLAPSRRQVLASLRPVPTLRLQKKTQNHPVALPSPWLANERAKHLPKHMLRREEWCKNHNPILYLETLCVPVTLIE